MTPANYAPFITTVNTTIGAIYNELDPQSTYKEYCDEITMTGGSQISFGWTGRTPKPRPWFGSRMVYEPAPQTYTVSPIPYELTLGMDRFVLDDSDPNAMSVFWRKLPDMATQWRRHPNFEIRDLLENAGVQSGTRQLGLDGTANFGTAHAIDLYNPTLNAGPLFATGTYCNDFIGTQTIASTVIGGALSTIAVSTMVEYMKMIPDESGEVLGVVPDALIIPQTLEIEARYILEATFLGTPVWGGFSQSATQVGTADNMVRKIGVRPIVNPWLRKPTRFYLADTSHAEKPLHWIVRVPPGQIVPRMSETDPIVFDAHKYLWGGYDRVCPAWNYAWLMLRSAPAGG